MGARVCIGVSLKMYFGHRQARDWFARVAELAAGHHAVASGAVQVFVVPTFLQVLPAIEAFSGTPVLIGAQDLAAEDHGAFTGEVSGAELAEVGVRLVEVGHAERRRLFGETDAVVAAKTSAALRNGLVPLLCLGEAEPSGPRDAAAEVMAQLHSALENAPAGRVVVAYEPVWAIGAPEPASAEHIRVVVAAIKQELCALGGRDRSAVIYGGSAKAGLLDRVGHGVDGLFLGRFAHDPAAFASVLDEAAERAARLEGVAR